MFRLVTAVACLLLVASAPSFSAAAAPAVVNVSDPAGDAGPEEQPAPGFEWGDIVAAWFEDETDTHVTGKIEVASAASAPTFGEVAFRITVSERHFILGWTMLVVPPTIYQGGFICTTDAEYAADIETCTGLADASVADNVYTIPMPRADIGASPGAVITRVSAYADLIVGFEPVPVDRTAEGTDYVFAADVANTSPAGGSVSEPSGETDVAAALPGSPEDPAPRPKEASAAAGAEAVFAFLLVLAGIARKGHRQD